MAASPDVAQARGQKRSYQQQLQQQGGGANTQARLVFRVCLGPTAESAASIESAESGGVSTPVVLQVVSDTIVCTQPVGSPEVLRASSTEGPCHGGSDLFLIGKNFARGSRVIFREVHGSDSDWEAEAAIEAGLFHPGFTSSAGCPPIAVRTWPRQSQSSSRASANGESWGDSPANNDSHAFLIDIVIVFLKLIASKASAVIRIQLRLLVT
uniref:RHD_dimer domain-containing protein n=1 Tax=Macrostomum lignano TaxID=282301 RepID=A0A1I8FAY9_9PLAT